MVQQDKENQNEIGENEHMKKGDSFLVGMSRVEWHIPRLPPEEYIGGWFLNAGFCVYLENNNFVILALLKSCLFNA